MFTFFIFKVCQIHWKLTVRKSIQSTMVGDETRTEAIILKDNLEQNTNVK